MKFLVKFFLLTTLLAPVFEANGAGNNINCPRGDPKLYSLPYPMFNYIPSAQNFQTAKSCEFVDLNSDGFVDFACSFCEGDVLSYCLTDSPFSHPLQCTYMNTKCGWVLAEEYKYGTDYCS
uniref:Cnidarian restricted protein n=1 Tax=Clytia hemisphaerica TaxID=252671 RepID=A0A7M5XP18_9CNID